MPPLHTNFLKLVCSGASICFFTKFCALIVLILKRKKENAVKKRSMLAVLVLMLALSNLTVFADSAQADAPSAWAKGFIEEAIRQQLVPEELQSRWKQPITREEFCQLALRLLERNNYSFKDWEAVTFEDTDSLDVRKVASADVIWGSRVEGTRRWFSPQRSITRQEAAVILYAAARTDERIAIPNGMFVPHVWKDRERSSEAFAVDGRR